MASIRPILPQGPECRAVTQWLGCQEGGRGLIKLCDNVANLTVYCNIGRRSFPGKHGWRLLFSNCNGSGKCRFCSKDFHCLRPLVLSWARAGRRFSPFLTHCLNINLFSSKTWGQTNINYYLGCLLCLSAMDRSYRAQSLLSLFVL